MSKYDVVNGEMIYATQEECDRIMDALMRLVSFHSKPTAQVRPKEFSEMEAAE